MNSLHIVEMPAVLSSANLCIVIWLGVVRMAPISLWPVLLEACINSDVNIIGGLWFLLQFSLDSVGTGLPFIIQSRSVWAGMLEILIDFGFSLFFLKMH